MILYSKERNKRYDCVYTQQFFKDIILFIGTVFQF